MTRYTLTDLERLASGAGDTDTASYQYHNGIGTNQHYSLMQPTIQWRIYQALLEMNGAGTRLQIARHLGIKKTPWLTQSIEGMVSDGYLTRREGVSKQGMLMFWYEVKR